jgi:hypothetical protein
MEDTKSTLEMAGAVSPATKGSHIFKMGTSGQPQYSFACQSCSHVFVDRVPRSIFATSSKITSKEGSSGVEWLDSPRQQPLQHP